MLDGRRIHDEDDAQLYFLPPSTFRGSDSLAAPG